MNDDDEGNVILDRWRAARAAHKTAPDGKKDAAYLAGAAAERAALGHFGFTKHIEAYNARFPDDPI